MSGEEREARMKPGVIRSQKEGGGQSTGMVVGRSRKWHLLSLWMKGLPSIDRSGKATVELRK